MATEQRQRSVSSPIVRVVGLSHCCVTLAWDNNSDNAGTEEDNKDTVTVPNNKTDDNNKKRKDDLPAAQTYDRFIDVAYTPDDVDSRLLDSGQEEGDQVFGAEPEIAVVRVYGRERTFFVTVQKRCEREGWKSLYKGGGTSYTVRGLPSDTVVRLRVRGQTPPGPPSRWTAVTASTTVCPGEGVWEALEEDKGTLTKTLLGEMCSSVRSSYVDSILPNGLTPLCVAVKVGSKEGLGVLIERGVSSRVLGRTGISPLHIAVWGGNLSLVKRLLSTGADWMTGHGGSGLTPAELSLFAGHKDVVEVLLRSTEVVRKLGKRALFMGLLADIRKLQASGDSEDFVIRDLVKAGVDVNTLENGNTVLDDAKCINAHPKVIAMLIFLGAQHSSSNLYTSQTDE